MKNKKINGTTILKFLIICNLIFLLTLCLTIYIVDKRAEYHFQLNCLSSTEDEILEENIRGLQAQLKQALSKYKDLDLSILDKNIEVRHIAADKDNDKAAAFLLPGHPETIFVTDGYYDMPEEFHMSALYHELCHCVITPDLRNADCLMYAEGVADYLLYKTGAGISKYTAYPYCRDTVSNLCTVFGEEEVIMAIHNETINELIDSRLGKGKGDYINDLLVKIQDSDDFEFRLEKYQEIEYLFFDMMGIEH